MSFRSIAETCLEERRYRERNAKQRLTYGVDFLDDALNGILIDDLVLFGAPPGAGKTQACVNIALANVALGRRVHYIALEAGLEEISQRIKYQLAANKFFSDPARPYLKNLRFSSWANGDYMAELLPYEEAAEAYMREHLKNLFLFYKIDKFDVTDLIANVTHCADQTDLILIDHVHYFDWDDTNDNRAIKEIAKAVRNLALFHQKPIILVAQLRKRDFRNTELCAGLDEFHGSSDLGKIATRVITLGQGAITADHKVETYFRICKNRFDGSVTRFLGRTFFNPAKGKYESGYKIGWANQRDTFEWIARELYPQWANYKD